MPPTNSWKAPLIRSQIAMIAFLKSSFVLHRWMNAATSAAMTPITIPTGDVRNANADPSADCADVRIPDAPPAIVYHLTRSPIFPATDPVKLITFPSATSKGPAAATNRPTRMIACFWLSSMLFSLSTKSWIFPTISRIFGISSSPKLIASSSSCDFRMVS